MDIKAFKEEVAMIKRRWPDQTSEGRLIMTIEALEPRENLDQPIIQRRLSIPDDLKFGEYRITIVEEPEQGAEPAKIMTDVLLIPKPEIPKTEDPKPQSNESDNSEILKYFREDSERRSTEFREIVALLTDQNSKLTEKLLNETDKIAKEKETLYKNNNTILSAQFKEMGSHFTSQLSELAGKVAESKVEQETPWISIIKEIGGVTKDITSELIPAIRLFRNIPTEPIRKTGV